MVSVLQFEHVGQVWLHVCSFMCPYSLVLNSSSSSNSLSERTPAAAPEEQLQHPELFTEACLNLILLVRLHKPQLVLLVSYREQSDSRKSFFMSEGLFE